MDTQKVTAEYRLAQWAQVMQTQQESGQNIKDFCQTTGISKNAYFYWQRKLRKVACTELTKAEDPRNIVPRGWMQITPDQSKSQEMKVTLSVEISGCRVTADVNTDLELLKNVCRALKSI